MSGLKAMLAARAAAKGTENGVAAGAVGQATESAGQVVQQPQAPATPAPQVTAKARFLAGIKTQATKAVPPEEVAEPAEMDLAGLADLEDEGIAPRQAGSFSGFADEIEATAPTREMPEDVEKGMKQFVEQMDSVYGLLQEPELLGAVIRNIMVELKSFPHYAKMIAPEDVRVWIRSMRATMGLAKIRKQETQSKRKTGATKAKGGKALDESMEIALGGMSVDWDNL